MIILSASKLNKAYGVDTILEDISLQVNKGDRVGIVGPNGAGKTTLLNMLAGELEPDTGSVFLAADSTMGYLHQRDRFDSEETVYQAMLNIFQPLIHMESQLEELNRSIEEESAAGRDVTALVHRQSELSSLFESKGGYSFRREIGGVLRSMAFPEESWGQPCSLLSGGENTRLALAALLLRKPDLLLLDEPTNHLDIGTIKWLETYLKNYTGTLLLISHDRYFLDQTVNRIFDVDKHTLKAYRGNYTDYLTKKKELLEDALRHYEHQQEEIARQQEIIRRFKGHNTEKLVKRAQSREKQLARMEVLERPNTSTQQLKLRFKEDFQSGTDVFLVEGVSKSFETAGKLRRLFQNVTLDIKRGERICMVGANGIGKSTLLKIILGKETPDEGYLKPGHNIKIGYYDQEQKLLNPKNTVLEELHSEYRLYTETELRTMLGAMLFHGDDVFKQISDLSGGEKARLSLLKMLMTGSNFLLLDEPTNHLDISAKEVFEEALLQFPGTILMISHDRYLLNKVPTRIVELTENGLVNYLGNYDYYNEKKESMGSGKEYLTGLRNENTPAEKNPPSAAEDGAARYTADKARQAEIRRAKKKKEELEQRIARGEQHIADLDAQMADPALSTNYAKLAELSAEKQQAAEALEKDYEAWMAQEEE